MFWILNKIETDDVTVILADPPDIISHKTGMDIYHNNMTENEENEDEDWK